MRARLHDDYLAAALDPDVDIGTASTVAYGDLTASGDVDRNVRGHRLIGQLYLVSVVA